MRSGFAIALHMHQPLIPAGGPDLATAEIISNLKHMMDNPEIGDNHNAPVFHWCYKRMGEFIPAADRRRQTTARHARLLRDAAARPPEDGAARRVRQPAAHHLRAALLRGGRMAGLRRGVIAVAPSTPPQDYRLHVRAWQHHFAAVFGLEALGRVRGFSPAEMALPNHPDTAYEFVKTLKDCGYRWVLVQEHTVERPENGARPGAKALAAPVGLPELARRGGNDRRPRQDPGQRHQTGGPDAAVLRSQGAFTLGTGRETSAAAGALRSPMARTAA